MSTKLDAAPETPALAKQLSTRPRASTVRAKTSCTAARSPTSHWKATTLVPNRSRASAAVAFFSSFVPQMATSAPAPASPSAKPSPMPLLPPVTTAQWPLRSNNGEPMPGDPTGPTGADRLTAEAGQDVDGRPMNQQLLDILCCVACVAMAASRCPAKGPGVAGPAECA